MTLRIAYKEELLSAAPGRVRFAEPMRLHTTFHIGGPAEVWAEPQDEEQLARLLAAACAADLPVTMVGGGANLLVRDEGVPGLVIQLSGPAFQTFKTPVPGTGLTVVGAALPLEWLIRRAQEQGLSGVEFLAGVPGRVGGAVRMNAGTHDSEGRLHQTGDIVESIRVMDPSGEGRTVAAAEAGFQYRSTRLDRAIVLEAALRLTPDDPAAIADRVKELWAFKKRTQDWTAPSVGCIFKNPETAVPGTGTVPGTACFRSAGWLVDQAGMKGRRAGGAVVSPTHANFILNENGARAADVFALIDEAREKVLQKFGVKLELEVQVLPHPVHSEPVEE